MKVFNLLRADRVKTGNRQGEQASLADGSVRFISKHAAGYVIGALCTRCVNEIVSEN